MASQCEYPSVWGTILAIRVQGFGTGPDIGNNSVGKISRKEYTSRSVNNSASYTFCVLKIGREFARYIY
jgi:hypothetical protein